MQILIHPELISGGTSSTLPSELNTNTSTTFDRPIIGYTQTLVEWKLIENSKAKGPGYYTEYNTYVAVYDIKPIYAT